uniref:Uncharacterized protein n=1 Tax=Skeletonema marinoi TaxID=267567 RepID=A0A6U3USX4_9STRA
MKKLQQCEKSQPVSTKALSKEVLSYQPHRNLYPSTENNAHYPNMLHESSQPKRTRSDLALTTSRSVIQVQIAGMRRRQDTINRTLRSSSLIEVDFRGNTLATTENSPD